MTTTLTVTTPHELAEVGKLLGEQKLPLRIEFRNVRTRNDNRFKRLNACIRDIARHELGRMAITEREHERVVNRWKRTDAWPRYSDPEPNYDTGEVMYMPKSRADLDDDEIRGIVRWLDLWIDEHGIERHGPEDNWGVPESEDAA